MKTRQKGLTLIELMAAILILAIISSVAIPAMQSLMGRKNIHAVGKIFDQSIRLARAEAARRSGNVNVRPSTPGNDWSQGWVVEFIDPDTLAVEQIKKFDPLKGNPVFTSVTFSDANPLVILPNGQAQQMGDFDLHYVDCTSSRDKIAFQVMLSGLLNKTTTRCQ